MGLSGLAIYKLLPKTNCKECGFPTCLAFAMKLAARQVELSGLPLRLGRGQGRAGCRFGSAHPPDHGGRGGAQGGRGQ